MALIEMTLTERCHAEEKVMAIYVVPSATGYLK